jgi:hypothetical protein
MGRSHDDRARFQAAVQREQAPAWPVTSRACACGAAAGASRAGPNAGAMAVADELFTGLEAQARRPRLRVALRILLLAALTALVVVALLDLLGQQPRRTSVLAPAARLTVSAPRVVRGGLLTQVRVQVHARRTIANPELILDRGWLEGMQVNGIEPQPSQQSGYGNKVILAYDRLDAGSTLTVWMGVQVDPTFPGRRPASVRLQDGTTTLALVHRSLTVLP